ncbi:MAG TPA: hypothetical protein DDY12_06920 [Porphyromonadaceae bacterium]|nr:hypothetical protein [Porphyromonadaceae bacterium]
MVSCDLQIKTWHSWLTFSLTNLSTESVVTNDLGMKIIHVITIVAALTGVSAVSAQTLVKEMTGADTRFIPGQYMKNGEAAIYFSKDEYGYWDGSTMYSAEIFDFELKPLKSFNFPILRPYFVLEERASTGTQEKSRVIKESRFAIDEADGIPPTSDMEARRNAFINYIFETLRYTDPSVTIAILQNGSRVEDNSVFINIPFQKGNGWYQFEEYLRTIEAYLEPSGMWGFSYRYTIQTQKYNGEWSTRSWEEVPISNFCTPRCNDVAKLNDWNGGVYLPFSQTFFNDDEAFEYVRFKAEVAEGGESKFISDSSPSAKEYLFGITDTDRDGDGETDYKRTTFGVHYTGLEVVNENNQVIYTFPMPGNAEGKPSVEFFKSDNSILAQVNYNWHDEQGRYVQTVRFYRIDKATSGVAKVVKEENHITAQPNPASKGTPVVVDVPVSTSVRTIRVNALNGSTMMNLMIEADETQVSIPTDNLPSGIYFVTLTDKGNTSETCKIIVR